MLSRNTIFSSIRLDLSALSKLSKYLIELTSSAAEVGFLIDVNDAGEYSLP